MKIDEMQSKAKDVSDLLKVLSSENRLMIVCQLSQGEKSVGELSDFLEMRPAAVSQQLALLRKDKLVTTRRDAQTIYYALCRDDVRGLLEFLYTTYCDENIPSNED